MTADICWRLARRSHVVPLASSLGLTLACAGAPSPNAPPHSARQAAAGDAQSLEANDVERFFPLVDDTVLSYHAWLPQSPHAEQLILQVERKGPDRADLKSGNSIKRLELLPDGVRLLTGGYLLKAPLVAGAEWGGPAGRVKIMALDQIVAVTAGQFTGCLITVESAAGADLPRTITTTYCPGVGIVKFSVDDGEHEERYELKTFGPRVDINAL